MIDIHTEQLVPIRDVPRLLPPRRTGRHVHISAVYRWMTRGVRGVRLEAVKVGGSTYTSVEALRRFVERLSASPARDGGAGTGSDQRRLEDVGRRVKRLLRGGGRDGALGQEAGGKPA